MSSTFIDMALAIGAPIIPVRLVGGLPVAPLEQRLEFPVGFGRQDYWLGSPLMPEQLGEAAPQGAQGRGARGDERARAPTCPPRRRCGGDPQFGAAAEEWRSRTGATPEDAVLFTTLAGLRHPGRRGEVAARRRAQRDSSTVSPSRARSGWAASRRRLFGANGPVGRRAALERHDPLGGVKAERASWLARQLRRPTPPGAAHATTSARSTSASFPPGKRHEYLVTRVLVRTVLGEALGLAP